MTAACHSGRVGQDTDHAVAPAPAAGRDARASGPAAEAALVLARKVVTTKGFVSDEDLDAVRGAGYSDGEIRRTTGRSRCRGCA